MSTESEILACVTVIRAHRQSPNPGALEPPVPWTIANLRIMDHTKSAPQLRLRQARDTDVRLDVVVKGVGMPLEQWRILPGSSPSDATALSLLVRSLVFHLRLSELYDVVRQRDDIEVVVSSGPVLQDDSAHRLTFSCGTDSPTTVQVIVNDLWRSLLLERDNKLRDMEGMGYPGEESETASGKDNPLSERSEDSGLSVGSFAAMPTPPMAPRMGVVGSFGTSPRVGQTSAIGSFVLPATVLHSSPAMTFAVPKSSEVEDMPPLVPLSSGVAGFASPNTPNPILSLNSRALEGLPRTTSEPDPTRPSLHTDTTVFGPPFGHPRPQVHVPFGIGSSSCDLDEYHSSSPASKEASKTPEFPATATLPRSGDAIDQEHRVAVTEFLSALQEFAPRVKNAATAVSVADAIKFVLDSDVR